MQNTFWKHNRELKYYLFMFFLNLIFAIIFLVLYFVIDLYWLPFLFFGIFSIISLCLIFLNKRMLIKISFSVDGIKLTRFKKDILFIQWDKIIDVKITVRSRAFCWLTFVTDNGNIDIEVFSKKNV